HVVPHLDQLDLVAVGILDKRDFGSTEFHRSRLAHNIDAALLELGALLIDILDANREMAKGRPLIVALLAPIVCQLDYGAVFLRVVTDKGQCKFAAREIPLAQELHTQSLAVELERLVEVVDANHRM